MSTSRYVVSLFFIIFDFLTTSRAAFLRLTQNIVPASFLARSTKLVNFIYPPSIFMSEPANLSLFLVTSSFPSSELKQSCRDTPSKYQRRGNTYGLKLTTKEQNRCTHQTYKI